MELFIKPLYKFLIVIFPPKTTVDIAKISHFIYIFSLFMYNYIYRKRKSLVPMSIKWLGAQGVGHVWT